MDVSALAGPDIGKYKPYSNLARTGSCQTLPLRLSRKSVRSLLYLLGFACSVAVIVVLGRSGGVYVPVHNQQYRGIIDSNKNVSLSGPYKITPFPPTLNPLSELTPLSYGPWEAVFPDSVIIGEPFRLRIECTHSDTKYCPPSYYIQFYGTTTASVPITSFTQLTPRTVEALMVLDEPGTYQVYAWPNDPHCDHWQQEPLPIPVHKQSVHRTPHPLQATGTPTKPDTHRTCRTHAEILDGRWLNHDLIPPHLSHTYSFGHFHPTAEVTSHYTLPESSSSHSRYTYSPYPCKIPHRTILDVIDAIKPLTHILFIGDSIARGYVCTRVFADLFGANLGVCEYHPESKVWEHGNKAATWIHPDESTRRSVAVTLAFVRGVFSDIVGFLDTLEVPQVVVFNMGYWVDALGDVEFVEQYRAFFEYVDQRWEGAHVLVRSTTSVVQPVQCFEKGGHSRANSYRMRGLTLDAVEEWAARLTSVRSRTKVSFIDAYALTDSRPETTVDGYHWMYHSPELVKSWQSWNLTVRPTAGEADDALLDWMWDEIITGRSINSV